MNNFYGKSALVTGSTSGIGLSIATGLAHAGANVMLNGFGDPDEIEILRSNIEISSAQSVNYSNADMSKPEDICKMIAEFKSEFGDVDILVNNAGIQHVSPVEDFDPEKWDAILAINLSSAFHTTRLCLGGMKANGWGRIINLASAHAVVASPFKSAYVAAKHGLLGLTKTVALECAEHGVTVNAVSPGYVKTALVEKQIPEIAQARQMSEAEVMSNILLAAQPTKKFIDPEQISKFVLFLCSDAADNITGASLSIDGGWTAQ